jgi:predicted small secreted protein
MRELALVEDVEGMSMRVIVIALVSFVLAGCSTVMAVADGVGTAAVYGVKTVINTVDAITPDIVNKK